MPQPLRLDALVKIMTEDNKERKIPVEWRIPEFTVSRYATNLVVQRLENEYVLSFFEVHLPIIIGEPEEKLESIPAECVARVIVAANKMPEFVSVLQEHLRRTNQPPQEGE